MGTGQISRHHLGFLAGSPRAELVGVCDLSPVSAQYAADEFGGVAFTDLGRMLDAVRPDVVHVLTPPHTHVALVRQAIGARCHVICEKPVAASLDELDSLLAEAQAGGVRLTESQNYRFNDGIVAIDELVAQGRLGAVRDVEVAITLPVRDPGGVFGDPNLVNPIHRSRAGVISDFLTHLVSVGLQVSGIDSIRTVRADWNNHGGGDVFRFDDLDALIVGVGSNGPVHLRIRFDCSTSPDRFAVAVRGESGSAETDLFHPFLNVWVPRPGGPQLSPIVNHLVNGLRLARTGPANLGAKLLQRDAYHGLRTFLDLTYDALASGAALPVDVPELRQVAECIDRLVEHAP